MGEGEETSCSAAAQGSAGSVGGVLSSSLLSTTKTGKRAEKSLLAAAWRGAGSGGGVLSSSLLLTAETRWGRKGVRATQNDLVGRVWPAGLVFDTCDLHQYPTGPALFPLSIFSFGSLFC